MDIQPVEVINVPVEAKADPEHWKHLIRKKEQSLGVLEYQMAYLVDQKQKLIMDISKTRIEANQAGVKI